MIPSVLHSQRRPHSLRAGLMATALVIGLSACSGKADSGGGVKPTQVAAKVGDSEISVHQINQVLGRAPLPDGSREAMQQASRQALERLIDQQLAVDAATAENLHRSPDVISALEAARREVLARAYMQKITGAIAKATPEDIAQYYRDHPALFSERRVFNLQEIRMADPGPALAEVRKLAEQGRRIEEITALLKSKDVKFSGGNATRAAEQLPLDLLPRLHALKDGEFLITENGTAATLIRVAGSQLSPVAEDKARPAIEQFINNRRTSEAMAAELKRMRGAATIAYMGEFQKPAGNAGDANSDQDALQRGIQGLK